MIKKHFVEKKTPFVEQSIKYKLLKTIYKKEQTIKYIKLVQTRQKSICK